MTEDEFWISIDSGSTWNKVNKAFWIDMEQACGFHGHGPNKDRIATAGFTAGQVVGHMHYGWMQETTLEPCEFGPCKRGGQKQGS